MKTIYISGKIDGCDPDAAWKKFGDASALALDKHFGTIVVNPLRLGYTPNGKWQDYLERDLIFLKHCDAIYMLKDWKDSAGARIEHEFAKKLGLEIIYEENEAE